MEKAMPFSVLKLWQVCVLKGNLWIDLVLDSTVKALDQDPCMLPWFSGLSCTNLLLRLCSEISACLRLNKWGWTMDSACGAVKLNPTGRPENLTQRQECINAFLALPIWIWPSGMSAVWSSGDSFYALLPALVEGLMASPEASPVTSLRLEIRVWTPLPVAYFYQVKEKIIQQITGIRRNQFQVAGRHFKRVTK